MAKEAELAKDPLMLLDYLQAIKREHEEIHHCRAFIGGHWEDVGKARPEPEGGLLIDYTSSKIDRASIQVEIQFAKAVISARQLKAWERLKNNMAQTSSLVALLGLLISIPLSGTMTRRIVKIQRAVSEIGQGHLGARLPPLGSDEIGRLAKDVNQMSERLDELDRLKKTFVASVTHELRSPLGAIDSYLKVLLANPARLSPEDKSNLERIRANATRLSHFVTNLLDMAKIERGKLDFAPRISDVVQIAEDSAQFFRPNAEELGIKLECQADKSITPMKVDPDLIAHVLTNFLSNALKFTRRGGSVRVALARQNGHIEFSVSDTGVGISAQDQARIFSPFERVKNPLKATGVGLGLAISKSIVEMHGGSIGVRSEPGKGSCFYFTIPVKT